MPTRAELKNLARTRLAETEVLLAAGFYDGAAYLGGYVVELALKARICRHLGVVSYPDTGKLKQAYAVHDLNQLLLLSGLKPKLDPAKSIFVNWSVAAPWLPERRYSPIGTHSQRQVIDMIDAVRRSPDGVFPWITKFW